jgi:hypothetical protein
MKIVIEVKVDRAEHFFLNYEKTDNYGNPKDPACRTLPFENHIH